MLCPYQVYLTVESFFSLGISSTASLVLYVHGKIRLFFFFWSGFLKKLQVILKSKQTILF